MTLNALIVVLGLLALLLFIAAGRNFRRRRTLGAVVDLVGGVLLCAIAVGSFAVSLNLAAYSRMADEQFAGTLQFTRLSYHQFDAVLTFPSGERADFALRGDEWQMDARMIKLKPLASLLGFDTIYRLDRLSGRYTSIDDERKLPHTVFPVHQEEQLDVWAILQRYQIWIPWFDALYGTAAFLPMADGAQYEIAISSSGLVARPGNAAARAAVGNWH